MAMLIPAIPKSRRALLSLSKKWFFFILLGLIEKILNKLFEISAKQLFKGNDILLYYYVQWLEL